MTRRPVCIEAPCVYQNPVPALEPIDDEGPHVETAYRCPWCHRRYSHEFVYRTFLRNALEGDTETQEGTSGEEPSEYTHEELKALRASERVKSGVPRGLEPSTAVWSPASGDRGPHRSEEEVRERQDYILKLTDEQYERVRNALYIRRGMHLDTIVAMERYGIPSSRVKDYQEEVAQLQDAIEQIEKAHFWAHSPE